MDSRKRGVALKICERDNITSSTFGDAGSGNGCSADVMECHFLVLLATRPICSFWFQQYS